MAVSTNPPSGFRDFTPGQCASRGQAARAISKAFRSFGFEPIETPALENIEVLTGKGGGENEKLIFKTLKRGNQLNEALAQSKELADMGLRFDLTLPLARFYARHKEDLPRPFKAFHIAPVWRAERAQKGRYREFIQCDLDVVGSEAWTAELEVMTALLSAFEAVGVSDLTVLVNDRRLLWSVFEEAKIPENLRQQACVLLDKADKAERGDVLQGLQALLGEPAADFLEKTLFSESPRPSFFGANAPEVLERLEKIRTALQGSFKKSRILFSPRLARGLDYYTSTVFEFRHSSFPGSLAGGGRYDGLIEQFGVSGCPSVGGSIGFERLILLLEESRKSEEAAGPEFFVAVFSEELLPRSIALAKRLRDAGRDADLYPGQDKLKAQLKYADKKKASYALIIGPEEAAAEMVTVKNMKTGAESREKIESMPAALGKPAEL